VNELGEVVHTYYSSRFSGQKIQVNHYFTKSQEEFMTKRERGRADIGGRETLEEFKLKDVNDVFDDGIIKYRAFLENRPEAESLHKPKDIIKAMTEFDASLNDGELGGRVDDLLGYWRFCRAELPQYMGKGKRTDYFSEVILAGLSKAFELPQPMWQCELFLSVMPELMLFNRSRVLGILKKIYPFMRDSYRQNFRWHRYEGLELLYNSLSAMEA